MQLFLRIAILTFGLAYIFLIPTEIFYLKLVFKIIPMILILIYAQLRMPETKTKTHLFIFYGIFLGMIGDATLHWFIIGLSAFLISHLFYIAGFVREFDFSFIRASFIVILIIFGVIIGRPIVESLHLTGQSNLVIPVIVYLIVILTMGWFAIMTKNRWIFVGSICFIFSDAILAWNMFVETIKYAGPLVMIPYYGAQFFIAHGISTITIQRNR